MGKIIYNPEKSIEEISREAGVSEHTVKKYIREHFIDREYDSQLIKYRRVQQYYKDHDGEKLTYQSVAKALGDGYSRNTVKKYRDNAPKPNENKIYLSVEDPTMSKATVASVSNEDRIILRIILSSLLKGSDSFDCDLTFSKGDFYRYGVQYPKYCFDLHPEQVNNQSTPLIAAPVVLDLKKEEDKNKMDDNSLSSVVIDLPQNISDDGISTPEAFADITHLAVSYYDMLKLAYQKLRYTSETNSGGLLIIKVGDIRWQGKMLWMSKIVTELATGRRTRISDPVYEALKSEAQRRGHTVEEEFPLFDMELADKYVHTYDTNEVDLNGSPYHSIKAHDYFLVFRKGYEPIDSETFYYGSDVPLHDKIQMMTGSDSSKYGPKVESWKSRVEGNYIYAVRVPLATEENHIDTNMIVSEKIKNQVYDELGYWPPKETIGKEYIKQLRFRIFDKLTELSNPEPGLRITPSEKEVSKELSKFLREIGVKFIQCSSNSKRHSEDCYRIIIDSSAIKIQEIESIWS